MNKKKIIEKYKKQFDKLNVLSDLHFINRKPDVFLYGAIRRTLNNIVELSHRDGKNELIQEFRKEYNRKANFLDKSGFEVSPVPPKVSLQMLELKLNERIENTWNLKVRNRGLFQLTNRVTVFKTAEKEVRAQIIKIIDENSYAGIDKGAKELYRYLETYFPEGRINVSNNPLKPIFYDLETYCEGWYQDAETYVQSQATFHSCINAGCDLVQVSRSPTCCDICAPYDGQIYSLSGQSSKYEMLPVMFPLHPHCRHDLIPYAEEFEELDEIVTQGMMNYYAGQGVLALNV